MILLIESIKSFESFQFSVIIKKSTIVAYVEQLLILSSGLNLMF